MLACLLDQRQEPATMPEMAWTRPPLEAWFDRHAGDARWHLGRTMIRCPLALGLSEALATGYAPSVGEYALRVHLGRLEGLPPEAILPALGGTGANAIAMLGLAEPGMELMVAKPAYYQWGGLVQRLAAPHDFWDPWTVTPRRPGKGRRAWFAVHPDNPTGRLVDLDGPDAPWTTDDIIVLDEVYRGLRTDGLHPAALRGPAWMTVGALSKRMGLPGLRLGWVASTDPQLLESCLSAQEHLAHSLASPAVHWVLSHWEDLLDWQAETRRLGDAMMALLDAWSPRLARLGLQLHVPEAGLSTLLRGPTLADDRAVAVALARLGVFVVPGSLLDHPGTLRIGMGFQDTATAEEALAALCEHLETVLGEAPLGLKAEVEASP